MSEKFQRFEDSLDSKVPANVRRGPDWVTQPAAVGRPVLV